MTVLMTFFGTFVFVISCFTAGFKPAARRLVTFAGIGALIDCTLIAIGFTVMQITV